MISDCRAKNLRQPASKPVFIFKIIKPGQRLNIEFLQHILGIRVVAQFSLEKPKHVLMRLDERSFNGSLAPF